MLAKTKPLKLKKEGSQLSLFPDHESGAADQKIAYWQGVFQEIKLQRETADRWFRYYLMLIGAPQVAVFLLTFQREFKLNAPALITLSIISVFMMMMYANQRVNSQFLYDRLRKVEQSIKRDLSLNIISFQKKSFWGADLYVFLIYGFLISLGFSRAIILLTKLRFVWFYAFSAGINVVFVAIAKTVEYLRGPSRH